MFRLFWKSVTGAVISICITGVAVLPVLPISSAVGQHDGRDANPMGVGSSDDQPDPVLTMPTHRQDNVFISISDRPTRFFQPTQNAWQDPIQLRKRQTISKGQDAFNRSCIECHDAQRALGLRKSYPSWLTTVRRMATKDDANVATADVVSIAKFLASLSATRRPLASNVDGENGDVKTDESDESDEDEPELELNLGLNGGLGFNISSTISPLFRGVSGGDDIVIENPGSFVDAWVSMEFDRGGMIRGKVTMCTSCHNPRQGFTVELVEATATLDLMQAFFHEPCPEKTSVKANVKAGRLIVPFGAISGRSHPGVNRTLTNPLMFNMGRRVFGNVGPPREPVLPMPYADEGVSLDVTIPLSNHRNIKFDLYGINGLQEGFGPFGTFFVSRQYVDNNNQPAYGGRISVGGPTMRLGSSAMSGEYQSPGAAQRRYEIFGVDATARFRDEVKLYFEYAIRDEVGRFGIGKDYVYGTVTELELRLLKNLSMLARYDTLDYRDNLAADTKLKRLTWGFNTTLPGGSLLIINHEHWMFPAPQDSVDIVGVRWVTTF